MSFWKTLGSIGLGIGSSLIPGGGLIKDAVKAGIGAAGAGLGAASNASANNRGEKFGGQLDLEKLLMDRDKQFYDQQIAREQEGRDGTTDAFRKLLASQHVLSPGARPQLSKYSVAPRQATDMERQGASSLSAEVMARLQGGNPIQAPVRRPMNVDPRLLDSGAWEKFAGYGGAGLSAWSRLMQPQPGTGTVMTQVPNVGRI